MAILSLSTPWAVYYRELDAMFKRDPDIHVLFNDSEKHEIKLYVDNGKKAYALSKILPEVKTFGNVEVAVTVVPANGMMEADDVMDAAFYGNPAVRYVKNVQDMFGTPFTFVIFAKEVVQYFTDNLGDFHGIHSTLYENIARDIFEPKAGVFFCTDIEEPLQANRNVFMMPLGEWP